MQGPNVGTDCLGSGEAPVKGSATRSLGGATGKCPACSVRLPLDGAGAIVPHHWVSNAVGLSFETLQGVSAVAQLPFEGLQGVAALAMLPFEALAAFFARVGAVVRRSVSRALVGVPDRALDPDRPHDDLVGAGLTMLPITLLVILVWRRRRN
jgi:hypothetical protein